MPVYRCWLYFNQGKNGWKESFHLSGLTQVQALAQLANLALARVKLLGSPAQCVRLLVTTEPGNRSYLDAVGPAAPNQGPAMSPHSALLVRLDAGGHGLYHRPLYLRGLPVGWAQAIPGEGLQLTSQGQAAVNAYISTIVKGRWSIRSADKENPSYPIVDVQPVAGQGLEFRPTDWVLLTTSVPTGLSSRDAVGQAALATVSGVRWSPPQTPGFKVNGTLPILAASGNQVAIATNAPMRGTYQGGGFVQGRGTIYNPITDATPLRFIQKDTGRALPFESAPASEMEQLPRIGEAYEEVLPRIGDAFEEIAYPLPIPGQINNARDFANLVFQGYPSDVLSIAVAQVLGTPNSWVVAVPGTNADTQANWANAIKSAFSLSTEYTLSVVTAIVRFIQPPAVLFLAGHSQGGMVLQNIIPALIKAKFFPASLVCFGSPYTTTRAVPSVSYAFFVTPYDVVPLATPITPGVGLIFPARNDYPKFVTVDANIGNFLNPVENHNAYPFSLDLGQYDPTGESTTGDAHPLMFRIGPIQRFGVQPPQS